MALLTGSGATSGDTYVAPTYTYPVITLSGPLPSAPTLGTGTSTPTHTDSPGGVAPYSPVAPYQPPSSPGVIPYTGPGEIITYAGGGGGLIVPTPPGVAPGTGAGNAPGTTGTGVPGIPNTPTVGSTTAYSSPTPGAAMPGSQAVTDFFKNVPTWAWIAGAVLLFFALKD